MDDTESSEESFHFPVEFPKPQFVDHFQSFFNDVADKEAIKRCVIPFSRCWKEIKKHVIKVKVTGRNGQTPADLDTVSLADVHQDVKKRFEQGKGIIIYPAKNMDGWPTLRILRADYTERDDKVCAMAWACFIGDVKAVKYLMSFGSYVDRQLPNGNTLMMEAVVGQADTRCACIELLLKAGARINIENEQGHTVVTAAAWAGDIDVLKLLMVQRTVNINQRTKRRSTALILAVAQQHEDMVYHLVENCGADLLTEDENDKVSVELVWVRKPVQILDDDGLPCTCDCCIYRASPGPCLEELLDPNYNPEDWCRRGACPCKDAAFDALISEEEEFEKHKKTFLLNSLMARLGMGVFAKASTHQRSYHKCGGDECAYCDQIDTSGQIRSHVTGKTFQTQKKVDCTKYNLVYCMSCNICGIQFVGLTTKSMGKRLSEIYDMIEEEECDGFDFAGHINACSTRDTEKFQDMTIHILDIIRAHPHSKKASFLRRKIKSQWIQRLCTDAPHGLNGGPSFVSQ